MEVIPSEQKAFDDLIKEERAKLEERENRDFEARKAKLARQRNQGLV